MTTSCSAAAPRAVVATGDALAAWTWPVVVTCRAHWTHGQRQQHRVEARLFDDLGHVPMLLGAALMLQLDRVAIGSAGLQVVGDLPALWGDGGGRRPGRPGVPAPRPRGRRP